MTPLTLFGQPARRGRWFLLPLGMAILLCLGTVYSWSIFRLPLEQHLGLSATASLLPYTLALLFYALLMPIAGFGLPHLGTRRVTVMGGLLVGLGYLLASLAKGLPLLVVGYGVLGGSGIGMTYGVPLLVAARWFPDRKGLAVGLTVVGFGLSPLVTAPLANLWIQTYGVRVALRLMGLLLMTVILALAGWMRLPPPDWRPPTDSSGMQTNGVYPVTLWRSRSFYGLWLCYALGTFIGLSAIGIASPVGQEVIGITADLAAASVAWFAVGNGVSRPLFGWLSDRFPPRYVAMFSYALMFVAALVMGSARAGQVGHYLLAFSLFWFCLGGWLAMAPTVTLRFFHPDRYAQNYGWVFTAYGAGALLGTLLTGQIRDWLGSYQAVFGVMAGLAMGGMGLAWTGLKPPVHTSLLKG